MVPEEAVVAELLEKEDDPAGDPPAEDLADPPADEPEADPEATPGDPDPEATPAGDPPAAPEPVAGLDLDAIADRVVAKLVESAGKRAPAAPADPAPPAEPKIPTHLKMLLDSDDPTLKAIGEAALEERTELVGKLDKVEKWIEGRENNERAEGFQSQIDTVHEKFGMVQQVEKTEAGTGNKVRVSEVVEFTEAQWDAATKYTEEHPEVAGILTVEEIMRRVHPEMVSRTKPQAAPAGAPKDGRPRVRVASQPPAGPTPALNARGGGKGAPPAKTSTPPENESMEQAIERGAREIGLTK